MLAQVLLVMPAMSPWHSKGCKQDLMIVKGAATKLAGNAVFLAIMTHALEEPKWQDVKAISHEGVVSAKGRAHDPGNRNYTAFWRILRQSLAHQDVWHSLHQDGRRWIMTTLPAWNDVAIC